MNKTAKMADYSRAIKCLHKEENMTGFFNNPDDDRIDEDIEEVEFRTPAKRAKVLDNFPPDEEEPVDELYV